MKKPRVTFEIIRAVNNEFFVRIVMRNGRFTWNTGETHLKKQSCKRAIERLVEALHGLDYEIKDLT